MKTFEVDPIVERSPSLLQPVTLKRNIEMEPDPAQSLEIFIQDDLVPAIAVPEAESPPQPEVGHSFWKVFTTTFVTIFLAELGDKTQMATLLMSAESHQPWLIFAGAGTALIATTLLGVLVGRWLSTRLSPRTLDVSAGVLLLLIAAWLIWDVLG
ncbi:TMEM165/GDT1 family protein [Leptodesmis sp.]|uniref:TMEM165/GDT1 family protein n=1 Tax=Leptodesmis sp. TaxID=3100501 RepID=UPI00405348EB